MRTQTGPSSFGDRVVGAMLLQAEAYEAVEADETATWQAALVVVLGALAAAVGALGGGAGGVVVAIVFALIGWAAYAYVTYLIGARLLPSKRTEADWGQLLRVLGFASAPRLFLVLGVIPLVGIVVSAVVAVWVLVATVVAIRAALDYESWLRTIAVAFLGWLALAVLQVLAAVLAAAVF
ncbi:MAG TPA: YIP1 family protein [Dehalococcoidia bacterium]|nr:YIP1 family protein [Dehalococcoidia bacterium]